MLQPGREQLVGEIIDGKYHLTRYIGAGAFGVVYEAAETFAGEHVGRVAVKFIEPQDDAQRTSLVREIQALAQLNHGHVIAYRTSGVVQSGRLGGAFFIVTELADGSLADVMSSGDGAAVAQEAGIGSASALAHLETRGAVHRDIKPANILRAGGLWKIADLGLTRGVSGSFSTATGLKGTLGYMAPEVLDGQVGPASDVYSLGVTLLECLTGRLAHEGGTDGEFLRNLLTRPATIPQGLPDPWRHALPACLAREPRERCSAAELVSLLGATPSRPQTTPGAGTGSPSPSPVAQALVNRVHAPAAPPAPRPAQPAAAVRPVAAKPWEREGSHVGEEIEGPDGAVYVWVPPGEFMMGTAGVHAAGFWVRVFGSTDGYADERPAHRVRITQGFWLAKHPVTNRIYYEHCVAKGRVFPKESHQGDDHPVVCVTWDNAAAYCGEYRLSLPTEAEWEYAARGSEGTVYPWGNEWDKRKCCSAENTGPGGQTYPVGSFSTGASWCGAHDLAGNVWEWCADWWDDGYYEKSPNTEPKGPQTGQFRVVRGGGWYGVTSLCRSAARYRHAPPVRFANYGLRPVAVPR